MEKEKRILFYFIGWFIVALCIFLIGIINAEALVSDYKFMGQTIGNSFWLSPNSTGTGQTYAVVTENSALPYLVVDVCATTSDLSYFQPGSSGNLKFNRMYDLKTTGTLSGYTCKNARIIYDVTQWSDAGNGNFGFTTGNLPIKNTSSYNIETIINNFTFSNSLDFGDLTITNQDIIINGIGDLENSITDTENNINQNIDDMEQSIVDSNKETQETIKDQFNECRDSVNLLNVPNVLFVKGTSPKVISLNLDPGTYTFSASKIESNKLEEKLFLFYLPEQQLYLKLSPYTLKTTYTFNAPITQLIIYSSNGYDGTVDTTFYDLMLVKGSSVPSSYEPYGEEICSNRIDETNDKLDNLQDSITDSSSPDIDGLADSAGWLPPGPLDSVLNLPLSLFNSLTTNLNKSCSPISIPLPYVNKNLTIPCINTLYDKIGVSTFITWLGVIVSGLMLYTYLLKLYKWIEDRISLNETHSVDNWGGL